MSYCGQCGNEVGGARFCGQCGARVEGASAHPGGFPPGSAGNESEPGLGGLNKFQLGALAYLTPVPALFLLLYPPYNRNPFLRFHSYQCLFLTGAALLLSFLSTFAAVFFFFESLIAGAGQIVLAAFWILAAARAWQGRLYRVPVLGSLAASQA